MQAYRTPTVPIAQAGPIADTALEEIIQIGEIAQKSEDLDHPTLTLMILTWPQLARELLHRRRAMDTISDMTDLENVLFLPATTS